MTWRSRLAVVPTVALACIAAASPAGPAQPASVPALLPNWLAAISQHQPGEPDASAREVSAWSRSDLQDLLILFRKLRRVDANAVLKRGALLHADVAMLATAENAPLPSPPFSGTNGSVALFVDGRPVGFDRGAVHWDFARLLLDTVRPDPSHDPMVRLWYRATAAHLASHYQYADSLTHLARARRLFDEDAATLFESGCLYEALGSARVQGSIQSAELPRWFKIPIGTARANQQQAETFFRRALTIDPGLTEARVRLGRVTGLLGHHEEAARDLRRAIAATDDSLILYYAELFLGDEEQALAHRDAARGSYERAAALYPHAQSPRLALSQLARRYGDRPTALGAIRQVLNLPADRAERDDPWWTYHVSQGRHADALWGELRRPFMAAAKP